MNNKKGFTLVELMAVISILGVLILIAVPSITALQKRIQQNVIKKDAELFVLLAKQIIKTDTTKSGPIIEISLGEIDKTKLNGEDYDETSSKVIGRDCEFRGEKFDCYGGYEYILKNNKYTYENGTFK